MVDVTIDAEGPDAGASLGGAAAFFEAEFRAAAKPGTTEADASRRGDPLAWATLILTIPPAIIAGLDLAERLKLIERVDAMLTAMRARLGSAAATIRVGAKRRFDLATVRAREIVEALIEAAKDDGDNGDGKG